MEDGDCDSSTRQARGGGGRGERGVGGAWVVTSTDPPGMCPESGVVVCAGDSRPSPLSVGILSKQR